ncbi:hypothetical protein [Tsukamurella soli]|uniref:hypothetical protein n=1 Tax=Tsukamurella soli TaxID=644556 RepID=UPI0031EB7200
MSVLPIDLIVRRRGEIDSRIDRVADGDIVRWIEGKDRGDLATTDVRPMRGDQVERGYHVVQIQPITRGFVSDGLLMLPNESDDGELPVVVSRLVGH